MSDPIRQAIPTPEQLQAMAAGFGRIGQAVQRAAVAMVEAFAAAGRQLERERWERTEARREAQWHRQQLDRDPTYFGRKRRARRARGRRIEARRARGPGLLTVPQWAAAYRTMHAQQLAAFADLSLGVPWGEITGDGSGEALPPIPDA